MPQRSARERAESLAGKIPRSTLERAILPHLGAARDEVMLGPRHGVDAGIIDIGGGQVMAVTTDPFYLLPAVGWERAAWFAVHIVASDLATSGIPPQFLTVDLNLPPDLSDADLESIWRAVSRACEDLGIAVVTGHTGRYDGCAFPTVGGATAFGIGRADQHVAPSMARPGDQVIVTKGAAIETVGTIGAAFPRALQARVGRDLARQAADLFWSMSVVRDAGTAASVGVRDAGVTSMHDATERGVWNAVCETAEAAGSGVMIHQDAIPVPPVVGAVCDLLNIDPFAASSEGTLVVTCRPKRARDVVERLSAAGIASAIVGELVPVKEGMRVTRGSSEHELVSPEADPFWAAYVRCSDEWEAG